GVVLGGIYLATRAKAAPEGPAAAIKIEVLDAGGNPVQANSPLTLDEGASYTVAVAVTNTTTKGGLPHEADLETWVMAAANWTDLIPGDIFPQHYLPTSIVYFYSSLVIPLGLGGATGAITVNVFDPEDNLVATVTKPISIRSMDIVYGATVTVGV
ncbi:unnamed protein product, partial [marine sediment metagenome]